MSESGALLPSFRLDGFATKPVGVARGRPIGGGIARPARCFPSDYLRSIAARVVPFSVAGARRLAHGGRQDDRFWQFELLALYQEPALSRFLPVRVTGAKQITFVPSAVKGERPVSIAGAWAKTSTIVSGNALSESTGLPLLVEASRGRGRIVYLALDVGRPPLSRWEGCRDFYKRLDRAARRRGSGAAHGMERRGF